MNYSVDHTISFEKLTNIFTEKGDNLFILRPEIGTGTLSIFNLEKGLRARFWNCEFDKAVQIHNGNGHGKPYFNLAFFSKCDNLQLESGHKHFKGVPVWDTVFISSSTIFNIHIQPVARVQCLGISFSCEWIVNNLLNTSQAFLYFEKKLKDLNAEPLLGSMTVEDKKRVADLVIGCSKKQLELFHIKSAVLKITSDFFKKVQSQELVSLQNCAEQHTLDIRNFFLANDNGFKPDIKTLAAHFAVSESTIKRYFKKQYGTTLSTYHRSNNKHN